MKLNIMGLVVMIAVVGAFSSYVFAAEGDADSAEDNPAVNVGNEFCPVSGENIADLTGKIEYEYNGKIYNLSSIECLDMFEEDPDKYSAIAEESAAKQREKIQIKAILR
ncbi:MAG: hypothetical protein ABII75_04010 [Candidatus Omnitrophota bacterium]